jgi:hypothetical protein
MKQSVTDLYALLPSLQETRQCEWTVQARGSSEACGKCQCFVMIYLTRSASGDSGALTRLSCLFWHFSGGRWYKGRRAATGIREVLRRSNPRQGKKYPAWGSWFYSAPPGRYEAYINFGRSRFLPHHLQFSNPIIRRKQATVSVWLRNQPSAGSEMKPPRMWYCAACCSRTSRGVTGDWPGLSAVKSQRSGQPWNKLTKISCPFT